MPSHEVQQVLHTDSFFPAFVNPAKKQSVGLINFLGPTNIKYILKSKSEYHDQMKKLKKLLSEDGEDPNQRDEVSYTSALTLAVMFHDISVLQLLLYYGGNPFLNRAASFKIAKDFNAEKAHIMIAAFSKPAKSPSAKPLTYKETKCIRNENTLLTFFQGANCKSLHTCLKRPQDLLLAEKNQIFRIFSGYFKGPHLEKTLNADLGGDSKFVELIFNTEGHNIIGFNLFEGPMNLAEGIIYFHWLYSLLESNSQQTGIASLLAYRIPCSLPDLYPDSHVIIHLGAIHHCGYYMVKDFLHFPKFQSTSIRTMMDRVSKTLYSGATIHHDGITYYTEEDISVKHPSQEETANNLLQRFFVEEILGLRNYPSENNRVGLILLYVSNHMLLKLQRCLTQVGIDFAAHLREFSPLFRDTFFQNLPRQSANPSPSLNNDHLFWSEDLPVKKIRSRL